ncbi:MAG: hypothetical protein KatS3mg110_2824 [Pirellulaceae bacterium]|nr:MAG: hypothetical protein KatS3mg110_2824 [Pirellulaceae bacterium]
MKPDSSVHGASVFGIMALVAWLLVAGCAGDRPVPAPGPSEDGAAVTGPTSESSAQPPARTVDGSANPSASQPSPAQPATPSIQNGDPPMTGSEKATPSEDSGNETVKIDHPFPRRLAMPEFPRSAEWLNSKPMKLSDLRGKFVLLDFWTYCCINCMHILPELKKLERRYASELVVIGVHSAKFDSEQETENIAAAILRYEIEHPVFNDRDHQYWDTLGVRSWPTVVLIDPEGQAIWARAGEIQAEEVEQVLELAIPFYEAQGKLDRTPLRFPLLAYKSPRTPLRFPGKVLADEKSDRLFIADTNHNRIVVATLDGRLVDVIGSGRQGAGDGSFEQCSFNKPQGMALHENILYVADTENHLIRKVDLAARQVQTIAGTGVQGRNPWPGLESLSPLSPLPQQWIGPPRQTALNSPWDLLVHDGALYIAMAGPHQIWKMPLDESQIGPYAGNGREDIVDGPLLPPRPYELGSASFAQPSGLSTDGTWLYVADSEGSSIRAVPFDPAQPVRTVVGTAHLPYARLFTFGDRDGDREEVLLQHCLAVLYHDGKIYVADTYNNKIKEVDAQTGRTRTIAGTGNPGSSDDPAEFYEPGGLALAAGKLYVADTNNHLIRTIDLATGKVSTLTIQGLEPPAQAPPAPPADSPPVRLTETVWKVQNDHALMRIDLALAPGWKLSSEAPVELWIEAEGSNPGFDASALGYRSVTPAAESQIALDLPVRSTGTGQLTVTLVVYYCQSEEGLCRAASAAWQIPYRLASTEGESPLVLRHRIE